MRRKSNHLQRAVVLSILILLLLLPPLLLLTKYLGQPIMAKTAAAAATTTTTKAEKPRFIFLIGLEGTGHHLYSDLVHRSPTFQRLPTSDIIALQQSLYNNHQKANSLWGAHCNTNNNSGQGKNYNATTTTSQKLMTRVVTNLKALSQNVVDPTITIPINGPKYKRTGFGLMSYPTYSSMSLDKKGDNTQRCALTKYPNMDLLYQACRDAKVTCGHLYLHRDIGQVLTSTTVHRHFHTRLEAMHLYTTMLYVIYGQLLGHAHQLVSCWDYAVPPTYMDIGRWLGYASQNEFDRVVSEIYRPRRRENHSHDSTLLWMEEEELYYFSSLQRAHEQVKMLCQPH